MSSKAKYKKKISEINFGEMINNTCQPEIVIFKFISLCTSAKTFVANICHIRNLLVTKNLKVDGLETYVSECRADYEKYRTFYNINKSKISWSPKYYTEEIEPLFLEFCQSPLVQKIMFCYKALIVKHKDDENWIVSSSSSIKPFSDCKLDLHTIHRVDQLFALDKANKLHECSVRFYTSYIKPNFDLEVSIEGIKDMLAEIQKTQGIKCDKIYPYIKKLHDRKLIDVSELNMNYLETGDKSIFVTSLMESLMKVDADVLKPDIHTMSQLRGIVNYIHKMSSHSGMSSHNISIAKDLLSGIKT